MIQVKKKRKVRVCACHEPTQRICRTHGLRGFTGTGLTDNTHTFGKKGRTRKKAK